MDNFPSDCSKDFRIWLSSLPTTSFPASILQKAIKVTFEPPKGLKNNLTRILNTITETQDQNSEKVTIKKLAFFLAFFHSVINERKKFGALGWNIPYEFTLSDYMVSLGHISSFIENKENKDFPWETLNYMIAEINYGGRVTDQQDKILLKAILQDFLNKEVFLNENLTFSSSKTQVIQLKLATSKSFLKSIPQIDMPEIFGLHENADISCQISEANNICSTILSLLPRNSGESSLSLESLVKEKTSLFLEELPLAFNYEHAVKTYENSHQDSMTALFLQEITRYNHLLELIKKSLEQVILVLQGDLLISIELEEIMNEIYDNIVPNKWKKLAYPSEKPLASWLNDLLQRTNFFQKWLKEGQPKEFWLPGFYFPKAFLTGVLQNYARKVYQFIIFLFWIFRVKLLLISFLSNTMYKTNQKIMEKQQSFMGCF